MSKSPLTFRKDLTHFEEGSRQADYARFVQLAGDGCRERKEPAELEELSVLLLPPVTGSVLTLVLHHGEERGAVLVGVETVVQLRVLARAPGHNTTHAG